MVNSRACQPELMPKDAVPPEPEIIQHSPWRLSPHDEVDKLAVGNAAGSLRVLMMA